MICAAFLENTVFKYEKTNDLGQKKSHETELSNSSDNSSNHTTKKMKVSTSKTNAALKTQAIAKDLGQKKSHDMEISSFQQEMDELVTGKDPFEKQLDKMMNLTNESTSSGMELNKTNSSKYK